MPIKQHLIGVDAGTSAIKAVVFDLAGNELASHGVPMALRSPLPNTAEQDANEIWDNVRTCLKTIAKDIEPATWFGIGVTSHGDGTWMIDADGEPARQGILWCDGRASEQVERWHSDGTAAKAFVICGTAVNTGTQACQLAWLQQHEPEILERATTIFHCKDWIFYKLTGALTTDDTDESLPMLNMASRRYDENLFELFGLSALRDKFPIVKTAFDNHAVLTDASAADLGLPAGMLVAAGPMDVSACALGVGAIRHGDGSTVLGTAGIHQVTMDSADLAPAMVGMTLCHAPANKWLRLMATNSATPNIDWFLRGPGSAFQVAADADGVSVFDKVDEAIARVAPGSGGIMYHPYLLPNGERAPFIKPSAKASFTGLSESNTTAEMLRAVYEGIALAMYDCYQHMPIPVQSISLSGGGVRSDVWCQLIADVMGAEIRITRGSEFGAKGAAINLGVAASAFNSYEAAVDAMVLQRKTYTPDASAHAVYQKLYQLYKRIAASAAASWDLRAEIMKELL